MNSENLISVSHFKNRLKLKLGDLIDEALTDRVEDIMIEEEMFLKAMKGIVEWFRHVKKG